MGRIILTIALAFFIGIGSQTAHNSLNNRTAQNLIKKHEPLKVIFDTDMDSDVDDVGALAILHAMMDNGDVEILAVMISSTAPKAAACADAINTYYGRPDLPIGAKKGDGVNRNNGYVDRVASKFPQDIGSGENAHDAVKLYRKILAENDDNNVVIISVGYLTNLEDLLKSQKDDISELCGSDLVKKKVKDFVCIGGKWPEDMTEGGGGNFETDGQAIKYVNKHWPGMISYCVEDRYMWDIKTGRFYLNEDVNINPVAYAYQEFFKRCDWCENKPDHHSADLIGVYVGVYGIDNQYTKYETNGYYKIYDNGFCQWKYDSNKPLRRATYGLKEPYRESVKSLTNEIGVLILQKPRAF